MSRHRPVTDKLVSSCFFVTISRGGRHRSLVVRPWHLWAAGTAIGALATFAIGVGAYQYFHDDMIAGLLSRQAEMQYAYEDRLSSLRSQVDRIASKQLLNQDTVEGRVHDLLSRQAQLESRTSMIASLARMTGSMPPEAQPTQPQAASTAAPRSLNPLLAPAARPQLPSSVRAFAPLETPASVRDDARSDKPRPEAPVEGAAKVPADTRADATMNPDVPVPVRLEALSHSLERLERSQLRHVKVLAEATRSRTTRLRAAMAVAGLTPDKLVPPSQKPAASGGPFVPIKLDGTSGPFEREIANLQDEAVAADQLTRAIPFVPLRQPLSGSPEVTSGFGSRIDPFMGRAAMHTGIDLREDTGAPVRSTAAGVVVTAGWSGGYGNLVEIDHGNGLSTRYGHLSAFAVSEGQKVQAGQIVGKVGSTGRSTGSHLHYEVRINGEAVDPSRFLRASKQFIEAASVH